VVAKAEAEAEAEARHDHGSQPTQAAGSEAEDTKEGAAVENEAGEGLASRMNEEIQAFGTRGIGVLFASGDSGYQPHQKYGSSSPFVTSVGGVYMGDIRRDRKEQN